MRKRFDLNYLFGLMIPVRLEDEHQSWNENQRLQWNVMAVVRWQKEIHFWITNPKCVTKRLRLWTGEFGPSEVFDLQIISVVFCAFPPCWMCLLAHGESNQREIACSWHRLWTPVGDSFAEANLSHKQTVTNLFPCEDSSGCTAPLMLLAALLHAGRVCLHKTAYMQPFPTRLQCSVQMEPKWETKLWSEC